jgi:hypothetical protein
MGVNWLGEQRVSVNLEDGRRKLLSESERRFAFLFALDPGWPMLFARKGTTGGKAPALALLPPLIFQHTECK